jgi:hypothetical protein
MHFHSVNKIPTNASEIPSYYHITSLLHVSAHQRRFLQGVQYEPSELLPNAMKADKDEGWDVTSHTGGHNIQPTSLSAFMTKDNNSAGSC